MAEMDLDSPQSNKILPITCKDLPMCYLYENDNYYVRDCYPEYYAYVLKLLTHPDRKYKEWYVSVTGTPGIGKSIFYIYFFHRYRAEHPEVTIVTASFDKHRRREMCLVYKPGTQQGEPHKEIPFIKGAFHLYDGPPEGKPYMNQMVCFTSPNTSWFSSISKERYHAPLYMPCWTLEELLDANELLDDQYGLDEDLIRERFRYVGGVPRLCLERKPRVYNFAKNEFVKKINRINSFFEVQKVLSQEFEMSENSSHRIFHYSPVKDETGLPHTFTISFCSPTVSVDVDKAIITRSEEERKILVHMLKGVSETATLLGWLFEIRVKEIFTAGGSYPILDISQPSSTALSKELELQEDTYVHANKAKQESFDGYFWDDYTQSLYLFQITRSLKHPVNAHGIVELLKDLQRQGNEVGKSKVFLVFVVPKDLTNFKKQTINTIFTPETLTAGLGSPVTAIRGIGTTHAAKLASLSISTVGDLQGAMEVKPHLKKSYQALVQAFTDRLQEVSDWNFVNNIPQYLLVLNEDY